MKIIMKYRTSEEDNATVRKVLSQNFIPFSESCVGERTVFSVLAEEEKLAAILQGYSSVYLIHDYWPPYPEITSPKEEKGPFWQKMKRDFLMIAGPCAVEEKELLYEIAQQLTAVGVDVLRGGTDKMRTSPYSFQGHGAQAYHWLSEVGRALDLPIVSEVTDISTLEENADKLDILQIGARNMYNYDLLRAAGEMRKPVILKRAFSATVDEWLGAAEYLALAGSEDIILCERGIRSFSRQSRNTLDISAIPIIKKLSNLPVIVDPSHAAGHYWQVEALSLAAVAAGADGLIIEVHPRPWEAVSDGNQSLSIENFASLANKVDLLLEWRRNAGVDRIKYLE